MAQPANSSPADLMRLINGYWVTQAVYLAAKFGIADQLGDGPRSIEDLAVGVGVDTGSLLRMLRALVTVGVFAQPSPGTFALTPLSELLREGGPLRYMAIFAGGDMYRAWTEAEHSVRTGLPAFERVFGQPHFEYLAQRPADAAIFNRAMAGAVAASIGMLAAYPWGDVEHLVDVGGGNGRVLTELLQRFPHLRGTVFELPHVVEEARQLIVGRHLMERCEVKAGDFFQSVPPGADAYALVRVLHDWPDAKAEVILQSCRRALRAGGRLLVLDGILDEGNAPDPTKWIDLQMLIVTGGRERTLPEWEQLFHRAGFARVERVGAALLEVRTAT